MALATAVTVDGETLQALFAVTEKELAAQMNSKMLVNAAQDENKKFATWMTQTQWPQLPDQVAERVCGFLSDNLAGVFAGAWAKYTELRKCAQETREQPKTTLTVALADHDFTYELAPRVEVELNRVKVASIPFKIAVTCSVSGLELSLKQGCVYQVGSGKCDCKAEIRCANNLIWDRTLREIDLPGELHLSKPIALPV